MIKFSRYTCYFFTYQMVFARVISIVERFSIARVYEQILGPLGKAVASVEAELAEEGHLLQVDDEVLHELELPDHRLLLFGEV